MSKNLKTINPLVKASHWLVGVTVIFALLIGFGFFYEQKFPGTLSWLQIVTRIVVCVSIYAWLVWLASVVMSRIELDPRLHNKKLLLIAVDAILGAIMVIILKNLIMPLIPNPTVTSWDFLVAGLLFFVALCCLVADYLKRLL